jgi:hypothetical protein
MRGLPDHQMGIRRSSIFSQGVGFPPDGTLTRHTEVKIGISPSTPKNPFTNPATASFTPCKYVNADQPLL